MKSPVIKRSIVIAGHKTSVSLEDAFWKGLKDIAIERQITLSDLVATIDTDRRQGNLSSAIRLFVLDYYRALNNGGRRRANRPANWPRRAPAQFCGWTEASGATMLPGAGKGAKLMGGDKGGTDLRARWRLRIWHLPEPRSPAAAARRLNSLQLVRLIFDRPQSQPSGQRRHIDAARRLRDRSLQRHEYVRPRPGGFARSGKHQPRVDRAVGQIEISRQR